MSSRTMQLMGCVCLLVSQSGIAQTERDLGAHEHGTSALNVVIEDNAIYVEFESPWMNLSGFEHRPNTPEQEAIVNAAMEQLEQPQDWFVVNAEATCQLEESQVTSSLEAAGEHDEHHDAEHAADEDHDGHDADHEDHDADHDEDHDSDHDADHDADHEASHEDHDDHDADHEDHEHENEGHSEVSSAYTFICENPADIETASIELFDIWSGIQTLNVQMAGAGGQDAMQLAPGNSFIDLKTIR